MGLFTLLLLLLLAVGAYFWLTAPDPEEDGDDRHAAKHASANAQSAASIHAAMPRSHNPALTADDHVPPQQVPKQSKLGRALQRLPRRIWRALSRE